MDGMPGAIPTGAFGQLNANFESAVEDNRWPFLGQDSDRGRRSYRPDESSYTRSSTRGSQSRHRRPRNSVRRMTWTSNAAALQDDIVIPPPAPWIRRHSRGPTGQTFKARSRRANLKSDIGFRESWDFDAEYNLPMEKEILKELENEDDTDVSWEALPQLPEEKEFSVEDSQKNRLSFLPNDEREVLERQINAPESDISYLGLFRYATKIDLLIVFISLLAACVAGAAMPLMTIVYGNLSGTFQGFFIGTVTKAEFTDRLNQYTLYFIYLAIGMFVTTYVATTGFIYVGQHVTQKIREHYLAAILRQNIGYFDALGAGEMTTRITSDINLVQEGISEKIGLTVIALATFVAAFVIGFIKNWRLTLILSSTVWAITLLMGGGSTFLVKFNKFALGASAEGASVAEEVLSSVRNAVAFGSQEKLARKYEQHLEEAQKWAVKTRIVIAISLGGMMGILYLNYGLSFWQGSRYYVDNEITLQELVTINLAIILGAFALGNVAPNSKAFSTAVAAAGKIFSTIDRVSPMNPTNEEGETLDEVEGNLQLRNVKHIYPSRPEVVVMDDVTLGIPAGKTTALVGASGSGKSTIIGLLERFYDPVGGALFLDGMDISTVNLKWLRQQMSLVGQEPVLFSTTIFENIAYGLIGTVFEEAATGIKMRMVEQASKMANAHEFIMNLPEKYETQVGQKGFLLSGGQKQRIAIARAVVKDPKILLLDEATSALDTKSEGVVQSALENASKGRTTIVIAHRLSTIKNADNIVVMSEGRIIEQGKHSTLLRIRGAYYNLVLAQSLEGTDNSEDGTKEIESAEWQSARSSITAAPMSPVPFLRRLSRGFSFNSQRGNIPDVERLSLQLGPRISRRVTDPPGPDALPEYVEEEKSEFEGSPQKYSTFSLLRFVASFNKSDKAWMLFGLFWAIIAGGGNPTQAVFFAKSILSLAKPPSEYAQLRSDINFWAEMYIMLAGVQLLSYSLMGTAFAYCSERLLLRARARAFRTMLRQDIAWFDEDKNSAGALTSFLATQTTFLAGLSGATLGTILTMLTTLIAAIALSIAISWKLALVCTACVPILLACGYFRFWMLARFRRQGNAAYQQSASYACEAANAIRTVASLTREQDVWRRYHESLEDQFRQSLRSVFTSSILYAASQSLTFLCIALGFWYGGTQIANGDIQLEQFFICFSAIIFGAQSAGTIFSFAPDMGKAKQAAIELKSLFDQQPVVDTWSGSGSSVTSVRGSVQLSNVHFNYPTRPGQRVLKGVSLDVQPGQYVALVGASGCGKSTIIALLERFYDVQSGSIYIDGKNIKSMNINQYRSQIALVGQEPTLYQGTIRENILLGATSSQENIAQSTIEAACRDANILDFIQSLPQGFETMVGPKATLLSGGQKQRLAIARALLRNPKILLLDEATSALDSESEKVVQAALDRASKGRTTISVAHRLSTIRHADVIFVLDGGEVVERGRHDELVRKKGRYAELVALQGLGR